MLFKWFSIKGLKFGGGRGGVTKIHDAHDLAAYNARLGQELTQMRDRLMESERSGQAFLLSVASHLLAANVTRMRATF